jgi:hypothetical protein
VDSRGTSHKKSKYGGYQSCSHELLRINLFQFILF